MLSSSPSVLIPVQKINLKHESNTYPVHSVFLSTIFIFYRKCVISLLKCTEMKPKHHACN